MDTEPTRPEALEALKIDCLSTGIRVTDEALAELGGPERITVHEYATTGGICFELEDSVYLNAAFDDWYCAGARAEFLPVGGGQFAVRHHGTKFPVRRVVPLPGYIGRLDSMGRRVDGVAMSHIDRLRLSPLVGCAYDCQFCDLPAERYQRRQLDYLVEALEIAAGDDQLPIRHVLISGGTPGRRDTDWFDAVCVGLIRRAKELELPIGVMMSARPDGPEVVERFVDAGIVDFAFNIELFSEDASQLYIRQKDRFSRPFFDQTVARAVDLLGNAGAVRSLIIPGLEPVEQTLAGIRHIASLGCDPVISPFRPARRTKLERERPAKAEHLRHILAAAREIVREEGVTLGPRCLPCQHNTLSFPWDAVPVSRDAFGI